MVASAYSGFSAHSAVKFECRDFRDVRCSVFRAIGCRSVRCAGAPGSLGAGRDLKAPDFHVTATFGGCDGEVDGAPATEQVVEFEAEACVDLTALSAVDLASR
jgi:hypothetical protein